MPSAKSEFFRLCKETSEVYGPTIIFHKTGYTKEANDFSGIVENFETAHPKIHIVKRRLSYIELIPILLHEIGHIIDYRINKKTTRSKLASKYWDYDKDMKGIPNLPKKAIHAILKDEDCANAWVIKLLKKHNVDLSMFKKNSIVAERLCYSKIIKYRFKYGKDRTKKQEIKWYEEFKKNPIDPLKYIKDLDTL